MGAWASLEIDPARVRNAHRTAPFVELDGEAYVFSAGVDATGPEAKQLAETALLARLGRWAASYGSPEAMLDAIAAETKLAASVQSLLAYGLLHSEQFSGRNRRGDVYDQDSEYFLKRLGEVAKAIADTAPAVLGLTGRSGPVSGGSIASVYDAYPSSW